MRAALKSSVVVVVLPLHLSTAVGGVKEAFSLVLSALFPGVDKVIFENKG